MNNQTADFDNKENTSFNFGGYKQQSRLILGKGIDEGWDL